MAQSIAPRESPRTEPRSLPDPAVPPTPGPAPTRFKERVAAYERGLIVAALDAAGGNQSEAARLLDMGRATLQDKMRKYRLSPGEPGAGERQW